MEQRGTQTPFFFECNFSTRAFSRMLLKQNSLSSWSIYFYIETIGPQPGIG